MRAPPADIGPVLASELGALVRGSSCKCEKNAGACSSSPPKPTHPKSSQADELAETPRQHAAQALLGELAGFFSQWEPLCLPCVPLP